MKNLHDILHGTKWVMMHAQEKVDITQIQGPQQSIKLSLAF